ncbi:RHS repeat-associated core domain-containing protein [Sphingomonas sp.]|uniref:RHS repeat-associated core domain-containing protein n=1 Tax=Sphingomonas sp. TaxID=28214 RepID=UPI001EB338E8|nr:RHS repeat-associated core domain-containing protein [Sphingomonas sp.]MBX3595643.1 AHH domain-containing protein [Sphingomonas sp.]
MSFAAAPPNVREFEFDDANRMRLVKHDGVVAMSYLYNGLDERVYRYGSGIAVTTLYDEDGKWVGDFDVNGQPIQQVIWMDDLPVGLLVGAGASQKLFYIEADALGTPRVVIDPDRNVAVWRWDLAGEAFGDSAPNEDVDGDGTAFVFDMRFPGQRYDSATGFNYNYYRDYDPTTGRYLESDPLGLNGGNSTYGYGDASPLMYSDPDGLIAGLVLRVGGRYLLPRLGLHLGAKAATRVAKRQIALHARAKVVARAFKPRYVVGAGCHASSKLLGQSLVNAGVARPAGTAAHHIVAGSAKAAGPSRLVLNRFNIGINDAVNGVFLPANRALAGTTTAAIHSTVHTRAYYQAVNRALSAATSRTEAEAILLQLRQRLLSGGV